MKTKEKFTYLAILCSVLWISLVLYPGIPVYAEELKVWNVNSGQTWQYDGKKVNYTVNGEKIASPYPGLIMEDGSALGPFDAVFGKPLGVKNTYEQGKDSFFITYQETTIQMTIGSKTVVVNGQKKSIDAAPAVFSFQDKPQKYLYVPTRFVAETLGFSYVWDASASTSYITRVSSFYDGKEKIAYSEQNPTFWLNGAELSNELYPGYVLDGTVVLPLKYSLGMPGLCSYEYRENEKLILVTHNDCLIRFVINSPIAYVDDTAYVLETVPRLLRPSETEEPELYLPAEFTLKTLGYQVKYEKASLRLVVSNAKLEQRKPEGRTGSVWSPIFDRASYRKELFSYVSFEQLVSYYQKKGYKIPEKVSAYSCKNSDAIYFQGVSKEQLILTDKSDLIEITVPHSFNPFGKMLYYEPENKFLNYFRVRETGDFTVTILKNAELYSYSYNLTNGCVVHVTNSLAKTKDHIVLDQSDSTNQQYLGLTIIPRTTKELLPPVIGERGVFTIRLPQQTKAGDVVFEDDYLNSRLIFKLPGNKTEFLSTQTAYNPVKTLKSYTVQYNASENKTWLILNTTKIQGCRYSVKNDFLYVTIDDPQKIYDKIIVLDAGHGGIDPGTSRGSVQEKNINFAIVNYAEALFRDSDIKVYTTRHTDTKIALEQRAAMPAEVGADFFISVHINANNKSAVNGTSVYYSASNNLPNDAGLTSKVLGSKMLNKLLSVMGTKNAGLLTAKFVVIHENTVPAILIELGFMTNDADYAKITNTTYQKKAANAIYDVVNELFREYPTKRGN